MWRDFRQAIGDRLASEVLAGYVEAEVSAWLARRLNGKNRLTDDEVVAALRRLAEVEASCRQLVERLTRDGGAFRRL